MIPRPPPHLGRIVIALAIAGAAAGAWADELVTGQLEIRGAALTVSPARQEVAPGLPTVVLTRLGQLEASEVPAGLRVEGELSGPGLDRPLRLATAPGDAFRIPGLNREGSYTLSGIRLVEGGRTISSAVPDSVEILVHRLVISSITSRALTPDEMDAYGIVIDEDNYTAWHYTVGFQIEGGTFEVPFDILTGPQGMTLLETPNAYTLPLGPDLPEVPVPAVSTGMLETFESESFSMPQIDSEVAEAAPIPGFIIIPTDMAFLNQFFSVIMVVQNGALADSGLELRNLNGVMELSGDGLRQAETEPPTIPGEAVPVLDPGPDGEHGTSDDLTFIVAQASGQATWLVEGLREGQHRLTAHLTGEIHGLPSGKPAPIEGRIPGVVVVRDPRFALTFFHPNVVRSGEFYDLRVSVTNTSVTPVYDLSLELPENALSGCRLVTPDDDLHDDIEEGDNDPTQRVDELLPGTTAMVSWRLESGQTGRVVASAFNSSHGLDASFVFEVGVGELGIPLSPESIVLPPAVDLLPRATVVDPALELLGLAHSLANAPNGVEVDLPPVGENIVLMRAIELAAAGQRREFGEPEDRAVIGFVLEWIGTTNWSTSFDGLRRQSRRGRELENALAHHLGLRMDELGASAALQELEELAISGRPTLLVTAEGAGADGSARLALVGSASKHLAVGQPADVEFFSRDLEGAAVLAVDGGGWSGEIGVVAVPTDGEGGWFEGSYQVQLLGHAAGSVDLEAILVMPDGSTRRFQPSTPVETADGGLAFIDIGPETETAGLYADLSGAGVGWLVENVDVVERDPPTARVITAAFNHTVNSVRGGAYRNVVLLLSQPVDGEALDGLDAGEWVIASELEIDDGSGGTELLTRDRHGRSFRVQLDPRILVATFEEPLNPHAVLRLSSGGAPLPTVGGSTLDLMDVEIAAAVGLDTGVVRGVVLGPDGGPLADARVELYEQMELCDDIQGCSWLPNLSDVVRTNAAGAFTLDAVRYRDETIPTRNAAFTVRAIDTAGGHDTRLVARLPGDDTLRTLTLAMVGRGDVVGTLRKSDGSPLAHPEVYARSITIASEGRQAVPDAGGRFRLEDLPVGPVQVVARDGQYYTSATTQIDRAGDEATVDMVLLEFDRPFAQVAGTVIDGETAAPVPGLDVFVIPHGFEGATHVATTDEDGEFEMSDVPPGVARFKAWSPTLGRYASELVFDLLGDATNRVEMVVLPAESGTIAGTVTLVSGGVEAPVAGAYVVEREQGASTRSDESGHYELTNLSLGRVRLEVWDPETLAMDSREVDLTADGQVLVLDFVLREDRGLGSVTVNLADSNGVPEIGAEVAIARFGSGYQGVTGSDGSVRIDEVPPGKHDVLVRQGARLARGEVQVLYPGHAASTNIVVGGLVDGTISVVADQTGDGTTQTVTPIGYRVPGVTATGVIGQVPGEGWTECELDETGVCHLRDLPTNVGSLVAQAVSEFYGPVVASTWIHDGDDVDLVINFEAPGVISGTVMRRDGEGTVPVEDAVVELWTSRTNGGLGPMDKRPTDIDGTFHFGLVTRGQFSLRVHHPVHGVAWLNGHIGSGQVIENVELVLRGRASVEGEIALCFDTALAKAGSQVRVSLYPSGVPRPFISDLEIPELAQGTLDLTLDDNDRASFMFADRIVGTWSLHATSALHGSAYEQVILGPEGSTTTLEEPLCLHPTGTVSGRVVFSEDGAPAPSATVQLFRRGSPSWEYLTTESTGEDGRYAFADIPVGREYQVRAQDAASNRAGTSGNARLCDAADPGYGTTCGLEAELDVSLAPLGRLTGVLEDQHGAPVEAAQIRLRTQIILNQTGELQSYQREWSAFTSADGGFSFEGVPSGTAALAAFDRDSALFTEEQVAVDSVASPTTTADLRLPPTAEVSVRVLDPSGAEVTGDEPVVVFRQRSNDHFREPSGSSPVKEHLAVGATPSFDGVVADRYQVGACFGGCTTADVGQILGHQFTTALGAASEQRMSSPPADEVVELELVGRAAIAVSVRQAGGGAVEGATVRIVGDSYYGRRDVTTQTAADGSITPVEGLGVGSYSVSAAVTEASGSLLGGSRDIEISQAEHGTTIAVELTLEASASAAGRVLAPDGGPSEGALVTMISDGRTFQAVSDADGAFEFPTLAADHTYRLEAYAANGLGRHTRRDIEVGADHVPLGDLVLDEVNPVVHATHPANGAQDGDPGADVVIEFSEQVRWGTVAGAVSLREQGSGDAVPVTRALEDLPDPDGDGPRTAFTRATLSHAPLASETLYVIKVARTVEDLAGRKPSFDFHSTFRTRDVVPPEIVGVSPVHDSDGVTPVGPDVIPIASCSEPMDPESLTETSVQLLDADGNPVEIVHDLQRDGFDIRIRPTNALELDSFYTVAIDGVTDAAGLALVEPYSWTFRIRDVEPPVVTLLPPPEALVDGDTWSVLEGRDITLVAQVSSNDALRGVWIAVDGVPVEGSAAGEPGLFTAAVRVPVDAGSLRLSATAEDVSGNVSDTVAHDLLLIEDAPPTGSLSLDHPDGIYPNHELRLTVDAVDDHGLKAAHVTVSGVSEDSWTIALDGTEDSATGVTRVPVEAPAGSEVVVSCELEDSVGQRTPLLPRSATVLADTSGPMVDVVEPASGASYRSGDEVSFRFALEDEVTVDTVELILDGEHVAVDLEVHQYPGDVWTGRADAVWSVPELQEPATLQWTFSATDYTGNRTAVGGTLEVSPSTQEGAPVVSILCPVSGDYCAPGYQLTVAFELTDEDEIQHYSVAVNGEELLHEVAVDDTSLADQFEWTPPPDALPGDQFVIRVEARDIAGNVGFSAATLSVPAAELLSGDRLLEASDVLGRDVALVDGTMTAQSPLAPSKMILIQGARLTGETLVPLELEAADLVHVGCGAAIDVAGLGYGGGTYHEPEGAAPAGVNPSIRGAAGSHGGIGAVGNIGGIPGAAFDSVYRPRLAGGGGSHDGSRGGSGGGILELEVGLLVLNGSLRATGGGDPQVNGPAGAGGTISIEAQSLAGAGTIDASGGRQDDGETGGGGRVALTVGELQGFDVENQISVSGGLTVSGYTDSTYPSRSGSGTIILQRPDSVYGRLLVGKRAIPDVVPVSSREETFLTRLPRLGAGALLDWESDPAGAWVASAEAFTIEWLGAWMMLLDPSGSEIGTYRVIDLDDAGRALIDGASGVSDASSFSGIYLFDRVDVLAGATLVVDDPLRTPHLELRDGANLVANGPLRSDALAVVGSVGVAGDVVVETAQVPAGSRLRQVLSNPLNLMVDGTLTIAAGGSIDVSGQGYAGDDLWHEGAQAPEGVRPAGAGMAGSHGGIGSTDEDSYAEAYGSFIEPLYRGGGSGSYGGVYASDGVPGGGVVTLEAGTLILEGSISADGGSPASQSLSCGAGGSVRIVAGVVNGSGVISARGGSFFYSDGGGGGRIALHVDEFADFDPETQVTADGGPRMTSAGDPIYKIGGHGTIFVYGPGSVHGDLYVGTGDCGGIPVGVTPLSGIGEHAAGVVEPDAVDPMNVWVEPEDPLEQYALGVVGLWVRADGADYRVIEQDGRRRILLEDAAGGIEPGDGFRGVAKLDSLHVRGCANLVLGDVTEAGEILVDPTATVTGANDGPPRVNPALIRYGVDGNVHSVWGEPGAILDGDGLSELIFRYGDDDYNDRDVPWNEDGSFGPFGTLSPKPGYPYTLIARDAHTLMLETRFAVNFFGNQGAPLIDESKLFFWKDLGGAVRLVGLEGGVLDDDQPVHVTVANLRTGWETQRVVESVGSFQVGIEGEPGDELSLVATDSGNEPMSSDPLVVTLPEIDPVTVAFDAGSYAVDEAGGSLEVIVRRSGPSLGPALVRVRTVPEVAEPGIDFEPVDETIEFAPGDLDASVTIAVFEDVVVEGDESFQLELSGPAWMDLGAPSVAEVTIVDNDAEVDVVSFSVSTDWSNKLFVPTTVDVVGGIATFSEPLEPEVVRGDRITVDGVGDLFLGECSDDWTCRLHDALGSPPPDLSGATVSAITPAFDSLFAAAALLEAPDHIGTKDLESLGLSVELLCYPGPPDQWPVVFEGWTTAPDHRLRIVAAGNHDRFSMVYRHRGAWTENAYRLVVSGGTALTSRVEHLTLDGLQIAVDGSVDDSLVAVYLRPPEQDIAPIGRDRVGESKSLFDGVEINGALIAVEGASTWFAQQVGILSEVPLRLRNSIIYETTGTADSGMVGAWSNDLVAENNTVIGGGIGLQANAGTVSNNLVLDSSLSSFSGPFSAESAANLGSRHEAPTPPPPNPPANTTGPVTFTDPGSGLQSDYHLECGVLAQGPQIEVNFPLGDLGWLEAMFDGDPETLFVADQVSEAQITLEFDEVRSITGTAVELSNAGAHQWKVEAAMSRAELVPGSPSYVVLKENDETLTLERVWDGVTFTEPPEFRAIRLTAWRADGSTLVHIVDWWLDGLNPACTQGVDLSPAARPLVDDVDGAERLAPWDIGADQSRELEVGFAKGWVEWWEAEGEARVGVVLSEPARQEVSVHFGTEGFAAFDGEDFTGTHGRLVFVPGEFRKTITVPLVNDGPGDDHENFGLWLWEPRGARLSNDGIQIEIREGEPPPRYRLIRPVIEVPENGGEVTLELELSRPWDVSFEGEVKVFDRSAKIGVDYQGPPEEGGAPYSEVVFPAGSTTRTAVFTILDDDLAETNEGFVVTGWPFGPAHPDAESTSFIRILDDDGGSP